MTAADRPTDEQIQDYIDGRLSGPDLATMGAYLLAHPRVESEIETLRRQNEALKRIGEEVLDEPIPERLRNIIRPPARGNVNGAKPRRSMSYLMAAAAILLVGAGKMLG